MVGDEGKGFLYSKNKNEFFDNENSSYYSCAEFVINKKESDTYSISTELSDEISEDAKIIYVQKDELKIFFNEVYDSLLRGINEKLNVKI